MRLLLAAALLVSGTAVGHAQDAGANIGALLAAADATKGQTSAKKCAACHDFTKGGPNKATEVLLHTIYTEGFSFFRMGYASAMTVVFIAGIFLLTQIQHAALERRTHYA